jgi:integrase
MSVRPRKGSPFLWYSFNVGGRRFRGSTGTASKSQAKEVERDQIALAKAGLQIAGEWPLLTVLNAYWHERAKHKADAATIETTLGNLQRALGRNLKASELTAGALMDYRAKRRGEDGVEAYTVNRDFAYLHSAYNHCRRHHRQPMPLIDWRGLRAAEPDWRKRFLSRVEYDALMSAADPSIRPIILCAVLTGLRKTAILKLDWRQVKLEERLIHVRLKGGRGHSVKIGAQLMAVISSMPHRKGRVFDVTNFRKRWDAAVKAAELEDFRFHDLRHTFASWARQRGADIADISDALGHTSIAMSMRYAHVKAEEHVTAFDRVSAGLGHNLGHTGAENGGKQGESA